MPTPRPSMTSMQADKYTAIQRQAKRYMEGVYGPNIWYQAPEVEENVLIRWIRAIAEGDIDFAEEHMAHIERMIAAQKELAKAEEKEDARSKDGHPEA